MDEHDKTEDTVNKTKDKTKTLLDVLDAPIPDQKPKDTKQPKNKKKLLIIGAAVVLVLVVGVVVVALHNGSDKKGGLVADKTPTGSSSKKSGLASNLTPTSGVKQPYHINHADTDSLDPLVKGKYMTYGECDGQGTTTMTHTPMDAKDISTIAPEGSFGGAHVTPIDHEYYYGADLAAKADAYPVYAVMDGNLNAVGYVTGQKTAWNITLSHSCTFMAFYNLMTSLAPNIQKQLPSNWQQIGGNIKIPVKAGDIIGYMGGQSLDFQLANTQTTLKGLLYHNAYNFAEPLKINGVRPLDYFSPSVKTAILPKYLRTAEPRDGKYDYDVAGEAVGNWFKAGTNGYAGSDKNTGMNSSTGHLALAYDSFDPSALVFSTGDYQGQSQVFAVLSTAIDWTKITPKSGLAKVELAMGSEQSQSGVVWNGGYVAGGLKFVPTTSAATVLIQLTDTNHMKVELFPGKKPAQVTGFDSAAITYDRGQDAHIAQ